MLGEVKPMEETMRAIYRGTAVVLLAATMVASTALLPMTQVANSAFAAGGGGGGEGKGGGDGGGKGSGAGAGKGSADAGDPGHQGQGATASSLGALNAAHTSSTAMTNAAPNSRVGEIAAYKSALSALNAAALAFNKSGTPANLMALDAAQTTAAQALAKAANKSITAATVTSLDALLGVSLISTSAPTNATTLATEAAGLQTKH
jgi:hypothetical protein